MKFEFLKTPIFNTFISGLIGITTGVISSQISSLNQINSLKTENNILRLKEEETELKQLNIEFNQMMSERYHCMDKVYWALEAYNHKQADCYYEEYQTKKHDWNNRVNIIKERYHYLGCDEIAFLVIDKDEARNYRNETKSVHSAFVKAHYALRDFYRGKGNHIDNRRKLELQALDSLGDLSIWIKGFREMSSKEFQIKKMIHTQSTT